MDVAASTSASGRRLGRYTLAGRIARGGMAEVHLARVAGPSGFEKLVALKLVLPHLSDEPQFVAMFLDEARLAARLDHPNIAQVIDLDCVDGQHFIVMEYVHGRDLRAILRAAAPGGGLRLASALTVLRDGCAGLHYAHELRDQHGRPLGLVHRDVSPQNLMVRYDGVTKLVDFGVAKASSHIAVTRTGVLKGKLGYFSPEQCLGHAVDRRSDVFALGVVAYEATTCMRLFHGDNEAAVLNRVIRGEFERPTEIDPDYPPALEQVLLRALHTDPRDRFASAHELLEAIDAVAIELGIRIGHAAVAEQMTALFGDVPYPRAEPELVSEARLGSSAARTRASARRGRTWVIAAGLSSVLATGGYLLGAREERASAQPAAPDRSADEAPVVAPARERGGVVASTPAVVAPTIAVPPAVSSPPPPPIEEARERDRGPARAKGKPRTGKRSGSAEPRPEKPAPGDSPDSMMPRG
jgi:eukaryotic-like serine/threonine-protein kinase